MGRLFATCVLLTPLCVQAAPNARDTELEQRGVRIGNIEIQVANEPRACCAPSAISRLEAGLASTVLGSTRDGVILNGKLQAGADLGNEIDSLQLLIETRKSC